MKLNRRFGMLMVALASIGMGTTVVLAQDDSSSSSSSASAPHHHFGRGHFRGPFGGGPGGSLVGATLRAAHQLNLTAEQKSEIKTILQTARSQARANAQASSVELSAIGNPADPNYATALQTLKTNAANRIQEESEIQSQIYNVLTTQQKSQLPTVLASIEAKQAARRAAWAARHSSGG